MKKTLLLLTFSFLLNVSLPAQIPAYLWTKQIVNQNGNACVPVSIFTDSAGSIYTAGEFRGMHDFDPGPATFYMNGINYDVFITKIDSSGNFIWAKQISGSHNDRLSEMNRDVFGNLILVGSFTQITDFDPSAATHTLAPITPSAINMYILKLDVNGNFLWVKQLEPTNISEMEGFRITSDVLGNIIVCGEFFGTKDLDPGSGTATLSSLPTSITSNVFVLKLDAMGSFIWVRRLEASRACALINNAAGDIFVAGFFRGVGDFDPGPGVFALSTPTNIAAGYIVKLNSNGNFLWAKQLVGTGTSHFYEMEIDCQENIYLSGTYRATVDFDLSPSVYNLSAQGSNTESFLMKLNNLGNLIWANAYPKISFSQFCVDGFQNIYFGGIHTDGADFDTGPGTYTLPAVGPNDMYIVKYNPAGTFNWVVNYPHAFNAHNAGKITAVDLFGNIIHGGNFHGTVDFDPYASVHTLTAAPLASGELFITKFSQTAVFTVPSVFATNGSTLCSGQSTTLSANTSGLPSWFNSPTSTTSIGNGTSYSTPSLTSSSTFYVAYTGCNFFGPRSAITISVLPLPIVTASVSKNTICEGESVMVSASGASTYTWNTNSQNSSFLLIPMTSGNYTVQGFDANGCSNSATAFINVVQCLSINEYRSQAASIITYPNPNNGSFSVKSDTKTTLSIVSVLGQVIKTFSLNANNNFEYSISNINAGIYFLRNEISQEYINLKIVTSRY